MVLQPLCRGIWEVITPNRLTEVRFLTNLPNKVLNFLMYLWGWSNVVIVGGAKHSTIIR